eukprot:COSAG02_NODE_66421_length_255_cov_0.974359_1_plen_45_part_01
MDAGIWQADRDCTQHRSKGVKESLYGFGEIFEIKDVQGIVHQPGQ